MSLQPKNKRYHGINFNGQLIGDRDYALEVAVAVDAMSYTAMDDYGFTKDLQSAVPDALVSHRSWNPFFVRDDTKDYMEIDAIKYANWISSGINPETMVHLYNEPSNDNVPLLIDNCIAAMDHCGKDGPNPQRLLVGNFAADKSWSHNGRSIRFQDEWLRLGEAFQKHIGWHGMGMTRYWMGDYRATLVPGYPHNLLDDHPAWLDAQNFIVPLFGRLPNGDLPPTWHGHSYLWLFTIWHERGWAIPHFKAQETFLDEKWDSGSELIQAYLSANYGTGGYNNGIQRGIWTWGEWLEAVSGMPYIDALKLQLEAMTWEAEQQAKHPALAGKDLGVNSYQWTIAEDWEKAAHSIFAPRHGEGKRDGAKRRQFHGVLATVKRFEGKDIDMTSSSPPSDFQWDMKQAMVSSGGVWVRSSCTTSDEKNKLFVLREAREAMVSDNAYENEGIAWVRLEFKDTFAGYSAKEYVTIGDPPTLPDVPDVPDETLPDGVSVDLVYAMIETWMRDNTDISNTVVEDSVNSWLDNHAKMLFHEWLKANMDNLIDALVKAIFKEWALHFPIQLEPDVPSPLNDFFSRLLRVASDALAPKKEEASKS